ncbi:MAG: DUF763 domain-containing protein [Candidatus Hodarchaeota archaeon]
MASLPMHPGKAPMWLVRRMKSLGRQIIEAFILDYSPDALLQRLSDPYWFQCLACVLAYDWHSSGTTTVLGGVLRDILTPDLGVLAAGGKGKASKKTVSQLEAIGEAFDLSVKEVRSLQRASRLSAKVDNAAVQDGYQLYHHLFFVSSSKRWAVIQQGMSTDKKLNGYARRYHWISDDITSFVDEPHSAILASRQESFVLDLTAKESEETRKTTRDLACEAPSRLSRAFSTISSSSRLTLDRWLKNDIPSSWSLGGVKEMVLPKRLNWEALERAYELQPSNFEGLLEIQGIGPATIRGLTLVSELLWGVQASWKDPAKFSFAYGGKDGVPFPVDRFGMQQSLAILEDAIANSKMGNHIKTNALKRLSRFAYG